MSTEPGPLAPPFDDDLERHFGELIELDANARERAIAALSAQTPALAERVRALLDAAAAAPQFLERPAAESELIGHDAGPWRLEERMAGGGAGEVYRARRHDGSITWRVAVKVLASTVDGARVKRRFDTERRTLAALNHPFIAPLVDAGVLADGRPFLATKLIEGDTLDRHAERLDLPAKLRLFVAICTAVQHAHERLIVHCDLKPSNIVVTSEGIPQLLDFGIARLLADTQAPEERALTPEYASPEQRRGEVLGTTTDVYSLGVILRELATGRAPHAEVDGTPGNGLPRDLRAIIERALADDPRRRYGSVERLARDVADFLEGRSVSARPPSLAGSAWMFARRNRVATIACAVAIASLGLAVTSMYRNLQATRDEARMGWSAHAEAALAARWIEDLARGTANTPGFAAALDAASARLEAATELGPETAGRLRIALGALYLDAARPQEALAQLERAQEIARSVRGFGTNDERRIAELIERCRQALASGKSSTR